MATDPMTGIELASDEIPIGERPRGFREMPDFIVNDVLDLAEYSDRGIVSPG